MTCKKQAADLAKGGAKDLIVDVRRTAEGPLENGIAAARAFVKTGTLAIKAGRGKPEPREPIAARAGDGAIDLPATVLVTTGTSGRGELFAAALNGNKRAELIGERTLGRAGIQKLVSCPKGAASGSPTRATSRRRATRFRDAGSSLTSRSTSPTSSSAQPRRRRSDPRRGARTHEGRKSPRRY